ncbi:hypothetical protein TNCV_3414091 [Trichonephila clavipes]|uniref:Peptidase aspartic putative domain-containing protein n=1 Tax=Trichonephila clavipes TaxID=2585209 RepID=A0A8X6RRX7_TRICX|nr:hypothetical protein TNCV_3414091 [Trichonephila clavipes]
MPYPKESPIYPIFVANYCVVIEKYLGLKNQQSALNSKLGWLLSGKVSTACQSEKVIYLINCHALLDLQNQIAKFWKVESIPDASNLSENQKVEKFYLDHTRRNRDGRYVVSLPFKNDNALGDSKVQAKSLVGEAPSGQSRVKR